MPYLFAKLFLTQIFSNVIFILISFFLLKCFWLHSCVFMSSLSFSLQNIIWYANFSPNLNIFILIMNLTFLFQRFSQTIFCANCKNYKISNDNLTNIKFQIQNIKYKQEKLPYNPKTGFVKHLLSFVVQLQKSYVLCLINIWIYCSSILCCRAVRVYILCVFNM